MARGSALSKELRPAPREGFRYARPDLRRRREEQGITLNALAEETGISAPTLSRIERRRLRASPVRQERLSARLNVDVDGAFQPLEQRPRDARDREIAESYTRRVRMTDLAKQYGLDRSVIGRIVDRQGVQRTRGLDAVTVDGLVKGYKQGASGDTLEDEFGIPRSTVYYHLHRRRVEMRSPNVPWKHPAPEEQVCAYEGCDEEFTPTGYSVARGWGRFCSPACHYAARQVAAPEERVCAQQGCEVRFTPYPSEAVRPGHGECCSMSCRGKHLFATGQMEAFVDSLKERGLWGPNADRRWRRLWNGLKGGPPTLLEKAEEDVRRAALTALDCYRRCPDVHRPDVVRLVVNELEGRPALFHADGRRRDSRDSVRRGAEKRAVRRLEAACTLPDFAKTLLARDFG